MHMCAYMSCRVKHKEKMVGGQTLSVSATEREIHGT
jgi:hypothetical protein